MAAPLARPYVSAFLKPAVASAPAAASAAARPAAVLKTVTPADATVRPRMASVDAAASAPAVVRVETSVEKSSGSVLPKVHEVDELPPALNGIYLARRNDTPGWGMTHQRASVYKLDGSHAGHIAAGTLVEFRALKKSSKGTMVECIVLMEGRRSEPVLVSSKELRLFTGSYEKLSARQMDDLTKYYVLSGKVADRKNELLKIAGAKNPHFNQYEAAHKKLMGHIEKANGLAKQRDKATGLIKMRLEDQLRTMKHEEGRLRTEYDAVHKKFREWKEQNAGAIVKPDNDPQIVRFSDEMAALRPRVPGLTY
ncbi:MAG: hypothetical protein PHU80_06280 [Kiritimatiellae bacterium]|nr:hypothetical protein [Kiritimatiellia bacterium]